MGLGPEAIKHRLRCGRLTPLHRGVYAVGAAPSTRERRWAAAVLACSRGAVLSHLSAAVLWGLRTTAPRVVDVTVPSRVGRPRPGLRVHRPRHLDPADITHRRAIPVTAVPRTLIDLAEIVSSRSLERSLDEAEYLGALGDHAMAAALARSQGRVGAARLAACLHRHDPGTTRTRSSLEEAFLTLVRRAGLPQPEVNAQLGPYEIDFLWRDRRLAVETDGGAAHNRASARERDGTRDAWLAAADFHSLRFTWKQVIERHEEVLAALRARL